MTLGVPIGVGATAEVFPHGSDIVKLYRAGVSREPVAREAALLDILEQAGVAAPRRRAVVEIDGRWGLVMTRAAGRPFADAMLSDSDAVPVHVEAMVAHQGAFHALPGGALPSLTERLAQRISRAPGVADADRRRLGDRLAEMPTGDRLCHGDFHPLNILGTPDAAVVIDWVDASSGPPMADVCRSYVLMLPHVPDLAEAYVQRYCARSGDRREDVERWLPIIAAARLCENIGAREADLLREIAQRG